MKTTDPVNFTAQLASLKSSLVQWEDFIGKSSKLNASLTTTIQCLAGFLEAFQKISDIAQSSNFGLRDLGMTMTRFCLRQRGVESRLRTFNSQLGDCLIAPLTDRLEEWKRTVNQLDRDTVKELRKARGELQRATAEAEKCKKRLRRKDSSTTMLAFAHEEPSSVDTSCYLPSGASSSVQANFVQQDLLCKQRALESLERNCLKRAVVEERRRFTELTTCLEPVLDAQSHIFNEANPLEEAILAIRTQIRELAALPADPGLLDPPPAADAAAGGLNLKLRPTPLTLAERRVGGRSDNAGSGASVAGMSIATGSAALSYAAACPLLPSDASLRSGGGCGGFKSSQLSLSSTASSAFSGLTGAVIGGGGGGGCVDAAQTTLRTNSALNGSVSTLHSTPVTNTSGPACGRSPPFTPPPPQQGFSGVTSPGDSTGACGDALSLFDAPNADMMSLNSSNSAGFEPNDRFSPNVDGEAVGYNRPADEHAAGDEKERMPNPPVPPRSAKATAPTEEGDGATSEDATEDGDDDEDDDDDGEEAGRRARSVLQRRHTLGPAMERSILYPNQVLPPPVYANFDQLQKAAAQRLGTENRMDDQSTASEAPTATINTSSKPCTPTRKYSQPSPKVSSPGLSLLRNLSINGGTGAGEPTPTGLEGGAMEEGGAGEGLSMSPPPPAAPIVSDSSSCFMQARSRIDAMFASSHATLRGIKSGWRHPVAASPHGDPCAGDSVSAETVSLGNPEPASSSSSLTPPPPPCIDQFAVSASQQQQQSHQQPSIPSGTMTVKRRVAGISRGSMLHLDRHMMASSPGTGPAAGGTPSESQGRFAAGGQPTNDAYCYPGMINAPMTPGPGRRQPSRGFHVADHYGGEMQIRPPRRSSSMSRELPRVGLDPGNMNPYRVLPPGDYSTIARCYPTNSGGGGVHRVSSQPFAGDATASHASPASPACRIATVGPAQASQIAAEAAKRRTTGEPGRSSIKVLTSEPPTTVISRLPQRAPNAQLMRPSVLANKSQRMHNNQHHQQQLPTPQQSNFSYSSGLTVPPPQAFWGVTGGRRTNVADEIESTSFIDSSS
uniref:IMD domain-containing protein n=2 Tax=Schistocephalus solidus TaxID=70667 RepID=A0A0X3NUD8_SCHSO